MAAEELRGLEPGVVSLDSGGALHGIGIPEIADPVAHDENARHAVIFDALFHLGEIGLILWLIAEGLVFDEEELVHPFDRLDTESLFRVFGVVEIVEFSLLERAVQRPLREGDFKAGTFVLSRGRSRLRLFGASGEKPTRGGGGEGGGRTGEETAAIEIHESDPNPVGSSTQPSSSLSRLRVGLTAFRSRWASPE